MYRGNRNKLTFHVYTFSNCMSNLNLFEFYLICMKNVFAGNKTFSCCSRIVCSFMCTTSIAACSVDHPVRVHLISLQTIM